MVRLEINLPERRFDDAYRVSVENGEEKFLFVEFLFGHDRRELFMIPICNRGHWFSPMGWAELCNFWDKNKFIQGEAFIYNAQSYGKSFPGSEMGSNSRFSTAAVCLLLLAFACKSQT